MKKTSSLKSHIGFWMRMVSNQVSHAFAARLDRNGVTVAEWVILREMYNTQSVTSPGVIAEATGLTRGAISKLMSRLLEKGLVDRTESSSDRRFQDVKLTKSALTLIPKLAQQADENDEAFFYPLSSSERKALTEMLVKLADFHQLKKLPIE